MHRMIETRLRKLEEACPERRAHVFIIEGATTVERQAQIDELIRSGEANASDRFICTGVTRSTSWLNGWNDPSNSRDAAPPP